MDYLVICSVALLASALTFFSGFGLGTLLLPAFALFFPVEQAVALTGAVHFLNGLFKLVLVGRHADTRVVVRFGVPAFLAAMLGAWLLVQLADFVPWTSYRVGDRTFHVTPVKAVVGSLLLAFALIEWAPFGRLPAIAPRWLPVGGLLSGFFGGLAGMQGALRSAFLLRAGLQKQAFVATGAVIAVLVDVSRLGVYAGALQRHVASTEGPLLASAVAAAFAGAFLGNRLLRKVAMPAVQRLVASMLVLVALGLIAGLL